MKKILVVDDNKSVRDTLYETLSYCNYSVRVLGEDKNLDEIIGAFHPDLIMIDYVSDTFNGGDLCHGIKADRHTSDIPVVMISAYVPLFPESTVNECDAILSKPFDLNELLDTLEKLLN